MMGVKVRPEPFVRVAVSASLERSFQQALDTVHAPFFAMREGGAIVAALREDEWRRIAGRFATARVEGGLQLISLPAVSSDGASLTTRLTAALNAAGVPARMIPSFHQDHVLVAGVDLQRCLDALGRVLSAAGR